MGNVVETDETLRIDGGRYDAPTRLLRFYPVVEVEQLRAAPALAEGWQPPHPGGSACVDATHVVPGVTGSRLDVIVNVSL